LVEVASTVGIRVGIGVVVWVGVGVGVRGGTIQKKILPIRSDPILNIKKKVAIRSDPIHDPRSDPEKKTNINYTITITSIRQL